MVVGDSRTFSISASDPDGDPVSTTWLVDGVATGQTASSFAFAPVAGQVGEHVVEVVASDGTVSGGATHRSWSVVVVRPDADHDGWTATPDCDESDPAVHPTANELLGNGIDDDCDAGTPDAPPGGLTGSMWSWGSNHNGTIGVGLVSAHARARTDRDPGLRRRRGGRERHAVGYAVLASGEVRGWGFNGAADLGLGFVGSGQSTPGVAAAGRRWVGPAVRGDADLRQRRITPWRGGSTAAWSAGATTRGGRSATARPSTTASSPSTC